MFHALIVFHVIICMFHILLISLNSSIGKEAQGEFQTFMDLAKTFEAGTNVDIEEKAGLTFDPRWFKADRSVSPGQLPYPQAVMWAFFRAVFWAK